MPAVISFLGYDPRPEPAAFPEWLRWLRGSVGLHQPELATALGVPTGSLHAWEKKKYLPSRARLDAVKERARGIVARRNTDAEKRLGTITAS
jgi:hypothetical protein